MVQYELAKEIQKRNGAVTIKELSRITGLSKGSVGVQLRTLEKKGYIEEAQSKEGYYCDLSDSKLDNIKPHTLDDLED